MLIDLSKECAPPTLTYSKSTTEAIEKGVKYVQI